MTDLKRLLELRVTACKKFIQGGEEDLTKRLMQIEQRRGQGAANVQAIIDATKKAAKVQRE